MDNIKDELSNINTDIPAVFLLTQVNLVKYQHAEKGRHGAYITVKTDNGLILSNNEGTKKIYFMRLHDLSKRDSHRFIKSIFENQPGVEFLMTNKERENLFGE